MFASLKHSSPGRTELEVSPGQHKLPSLCQHGSCPKDEHTT